MITHILTEYFLKIVKTIIEVNPIMKKISNFKEMELYSIISMCLFH